MQELHKIFGQTDAFFGPSHEHSLTALTNLTGHPAIAMRAGIEKIKTRPRYELPKGSINTNLHSIPRLVQLWSSLFEEGKLITIARDLEERIGVVGSGLRCGRHFKCGGGAVFVAVGILSILGQIRSTAPAGSTSLVTHTHAWMSTSYFLE